MDRNVILSQLRDYITENFLYARPDFELSDDDALLGRGIVDSMGVMEVVVFLEEQYGLQVDDADITEENLGSMNAIASYVAARVGDSADERQIA